MSASVNKAIIVGNLGADPELRYTNGGKAVAELRIATTNQWTGADGQKQEQTEWHRVVAWGPLGENAAKYLKKGRQAYVEGRIQTRTYDDKEGVKRYITEIVANEIKFLGTAGGDQGDSRESQPRGERTQKPAGNQNTGRKQSTPQGNAFDDDIPF